MLYFGLVESFQQCMKRIGLVLTNKACVVFGLATFMSNDSFVVNISSL